MTTLTDAEHEVIARLEQAGIINDIRRNLGLDVNDDNIPDEDKYWMTYPEWVKDIMNKMDEGHV